MSELLSIWNDSQLRAASPPPSFNIPNNPNAKSLKINNQSRYWLIVYKTHSNIDVDRIEPFSYLTIPFERDISIRIDQGNAVSSLQADKMFVDYSTIDGGVIVFSKGSTQFNGSSVVSIAGSVNISNSSLNVAIQGTPTFNLGAGNSISISGTPTFNVGTMPAVTFAAGSTVSISGSPTMNIGTMPNVTIANAAIKVQLDQTGGNNTISLASGSTVAITGTPTFNIGTMPSVTISGGVTISGTPTMNIGTMPSVTINNAAIKVQIDQTGGNNTISLAAGSSVSISGTPTFNIGTMPNVTFAAGSSVSITGTPTMNIGTMPNVSIANATLNVKLDQTSGNNSVVISGTPSVSISGTPTMNIGTMPNVTFAAGSSVSITGTPTMNIGTMPNVTIANSTLNVALSGTNTVNIGSMPNVNITSGTVTVSSATVVNSQLPVAQVYTYKQAFTYPANSTANFAIEVQFLPNGTVADVQKGTIYIKSALGVNYNVTTLYGRTTFADGQTFDNTVYFNFSQPAAGEVDFSGASTLCNRLHFTIWAPSTNASADTVTVYYLIDGTSTAIDTPQGYGVPTQPSSDMITDVSAGINAANTSQQVIPATSYYNRRYLFFQNISDTDMWINWDFGAAVNSQGSILIPANGGSLTYEGSFVPRGQLNVACSVLGKNFTCKWA